VISALVIILYLLLGLLAARLAYNRFGLGDVPDDDMVLLVVTFFWPAFAVIGLLGLFGLTVKWFAKAGRR
jgi:hypothetical protein